MLGIVGAIIMYLCGILSGIALVALYGQAFTRGEKTYVLCTGAAATIAGICILFIINRSSI